MLELDLNFKCDIEAIESMNTIYSLEDFKSTEEIETFIAYLCLNIDMMGKAEFCLSINHSKLSFSWCPTLLYFLTELPLIINSIDCHELEKYTIILDPEVNEWELIFDRSRKKRTAIIQFDDREGKIVKTEITSKELKEKFNFLIKKFINLINKIFPDLLKIKIFHQWTVSSLYETF
ncbi:hypothetical protein [Lusitaniella coriacea]|uniref:hypothetical protein n=1 Tax=Lusitaniella coriacea TaxID=1983105 RepID=UPI003CF3C041